MNETEQPLTQNEETLNSAASPAVKSRWRRLFENLFGIDLRALGLFRIGVALLVLSDLWVRVQDIEAHYTEFGVMPRDAVLQYNGNFWAYLSPYMWTGWVKDFVGWSEVTQIALLFGVTAFFSLMLLVGYRTRMAIILVWLLYCALHTRNPLVLHGGDSMTRMLLFWGMFVPLGARFSIDGGAAIWRAYRKQPPVRIATFGTASLLLQIALIYWFTVALKTSPTWRTEFSALYYALSIDQYGSTFGRFLLGFPKLLPLLTCITIYWEAFGPIFAFLPWKTQQFRAFACAGFIFFHLVAINLAMDIGSFPFVATVGWLVFLPAFVLDNFARGWGRGPNWAGRRVADTVREKVVAFRNRSIAIRVKKGVACPSLQSSRLGAFFAFVLLLYIILFNLRTVNQVFWTRVLPRSTDVLINFTRTDQMWGMFSPYPMTDDGWYVIPGKTVDGTEFDVYTSSAPVRYDKPAFVAGLYKNERWRKYLMNLWNPANMPQRSFYAQYLCRNWNRWHKGTQELYELKIVYMREDTPPPGKPYVAPYKVVAWQHWCQEDVAIRMIEAAKKEQQELAKKAARLEAIRRGIPEKEYDNLTNQQK